MEPQTSLRFLCLHGWRTSPDVLKFQLRDLSKSFTDYCQANFPSVKCEFVCLQAPFPAKGPPHDDVSKFFGAKGPYYEWYDRPEDPDGRIIYDGAKQSVDFVLNVVETQGPFDVVVGFSQGASMTTILNAVQKQKKMVAWKACILISGRAPQDEVHGQLLAQVAPLTIPTIIIVGEKDFLKDAAIASGEFYPQHLLLMHPRGHQFPAMTEFRDSYTKIAEHICNLCLNPPQDEDCSGKL